MSSPFPPSRTGAAALPDLPAELIGEIAAHLVTGHHDGYPGRQLCSLRLVSRVFPKATEHVFTRSTFTERRVDICSGDLQRLHEVKSNSTYANAIQSLRFDRRDARALEALSQLNATTGDTGTGHMCLLDGPLIHFQLAGLFQILTNLRILTISAPLLYADSVSRRLYGHEHDRMTDDIVCSILLATAAASSMKIEELKVSSPSETDFGISFGRLATVVNGDLLTLRVDKKHWEGFRNLRSLKLPLQTSSDCEPQGWTKLLISMLQNMPDLRTLHLSYQEHRIGWSYPVFAALEDLRLPFLTEISIANMYSSPEDLLHFLNTYKDTLTDLSIDNYQLVEGQGWKPILAKLCRNNKSLARLYLDRLQEGGQLVQLRPFMHVIFREKYLLRVTEKSKIKETLNKAIQTMVLVNG